MFTLGIFTPLMEWFYTFTTTNHTNFHQLEHIFQGFLRNVVDCLTLRWNRAERKYPVQTNVDVSG